MTSKISVSSVLFVVLTVPLTCFAFDYSMDSSIQTGFEYDTNVYKNFNRSLEDFLFRGLLKLSPVLRWDSSQLSSTYRIGGKKYFTKSSQDTIINELEVDYDHLFSPKLGLSPSFSAKYQFEDASIDTENLDINETFLDTTANLILKWSPGRGLKVNPSAGFSLFVFDDAFPQYGFLKHNYGLTVGKSLSRLTEAGFAYSFSAYHFESSPRTDLLNEVSAFMRYSGSLYLSLAYTYQSDHSNIEQLSFSNNRISTIASLPLQLRGGIKSTASSDPDLVLSLILILQFKHYPSIIAVDVEGRRYLLSQSEEDNFNIIIFKVTKSLARHLSAEFKYTRHSNDFSSAGRDYSRSVFYLGAMYNF